MNIYPNHTLLSSITLLEITLKKKVVFKINILIAEISKKWWDFFVVLLVCFVSTIRNRQTWIKKCMKIWGR